MSKERELLKECRLMLDNPINGTAGRNLQIKITELLAQPEREQEPVAWMCNLLGNVVTDKPDDNNGYTPLYKSPQKRKSLSGKESEALWEAEFKSAISYLVFDEICVAINQYKGKAIL